MAVFKFFPKEIYYYVPGVNASDIHYTLISHLERHKPFCAGITTPFCCNVRVLKWFLQRNIRWMDTRREQIVVLLTSLSILYKISQVGRGPN